MAKYQKLYDITTKQERTDAILRVEDGAVVPFDPLNRDYIAYKVWEDQGNVPAPMPALVDVALSTATTTANASVKVG